MKTSLQEQLSTVPEGGHLCLFYERDAVELIPALVGFVQEGLQSNEQFIYVAETQTIEALREQLESSGVDVSGEISGGRLRFVASEQWQEAGVYNFAKRTTDIQTFIEQAKGAGFKGVRFGVEMTFGSGPEISCADLEHWEASLNTLFTPGFPGRFICQYNSNRFSPEVILAALHTHPLAIVGTEVFPNPFYKAPLILQANGSRKNYSAIEQTKSAHAEVQWMISQLKRARMAEDLRESAAVHQARLAEAESGKKKIEVILDSISDGFAALDTDWNFAFINKAAEKLFGCAAENIVGKSIWSEYHELAGSTFESECRRATAERRRVDFEYFHPLRDRWLHFHAYPSEHGGLTLYFQDITEKKKTERQLRESELLNQSIIECSRECIKLLGLDGVLLFISKAGQKQLCISGAEDFVGKSWIDLWQSPYREAARNAVAAASKGGTGSFTGNFPTLDGSPKWWDVVITPILNDVGIPGKLLAISRDVTDRVESEEKLRESESRLKLALAAGQMGVWEWNIASGRVVWSPSLEQLHGIPPGSFGGGFEDFKRDIYPEDTEMVLGNIRDAVEKRKVYHLVYRIRRPDGQIRFIETFGKVLLNSEGEPEKMAGICMDITERKTVEQALQDREDRLRAIFDNSPECVKIVANDGTILSMNPAGLSMVQAERPEDVVGRSVYGLISHEFREAYKAMHHRVCQGNKECMEFQLVGLKGTCRWMETHAAPIRDSKTGELIHLAITRDITSRKRAEAQVTYQKVVLERIVRGDPLEEILEQLTESVEANIGRKLYATVHLADKEGKTLFPAAGNSIPREWREYIASVPVAPNAGSCGSSAYLGERVIIPDIATDVRWRDYRETALRCGLRACWSTPIISSREKVLGTFAIYYPEPGTPTEEEIHLVDVIARTAAISIERTQSDEMRLRLAAIVESSEDAIIGKNLQGIITSWNKGAERLYGYTESEMVGQSITLLIPQHLQYEEPQILERLARGERIDHFETVRQHKNGTLLNISLTISPIRDSHGKIIGVSKIARNITDRKRAELHQQALFELASTVNRAERIEDMYEAAITAICHCNLADRASILLYDADGVMRFKAWRGLSDLYRKAVEGHSPWKRDDPNPECVCIQDISKAPIDEHLRGVVMRENIHALAFIPITYERKLIGKFMIYYDRVHSFPSEELRTSQTIASQVAFAIERQRSGEALERLVNERTASLREAIQQMEEFSYTVSHDLRAPLRGMHGYGTALAEDYGHLLPPEAHRYLTRITENAARLDRMIMDVLTYGRLGRSELKLEKIDLDKLARDIIQQYPGMQPPNAEIKIETLYPVVGHEPSLVQAISNLLSNAVKFVVPGITPQIRIWSERTGTLVRCWVEDNGIGIHPKYHHRLFNMFERVHPQLEYEGTGVGLAIVRKALERMGGKCGLESDGANGCRFWIALPSAEVKP